MTPRGVVRIALLTVLALPGSVDAQITVTVVDAVSGNPVPLAAVQSVDGDGRLLETRSSGPGGRAVLRSDLGASRLRVLALGYATSVVELEGRDRIEVALEPEALVMDSLQVEVERRGPVPGRLEFTRRRETESGVFLDPVDIALKTKYGVVEAFRDIEGIRRTNWGGPRIVPTIVSNKGSGCMRYRLNNRRVRASSWNAWPLSSLLPRDVVAMEIYRHFGEVPERLRGDAWPTSGPPCGLVVIWTTEAW